MKLNWDSLLEPIFLFILSLIAGTLWVIVPIQSKPLPNAVPLALTTARRKPTPEPDPPARDRDLLAKTRRLVI